MLDKTVTRVFSCSAVFVATAILVAISAIAPGMAEEADARPPRPIELDKADIQKRLSGLPKSSGQFFVSNPEINQRGAERSSTAKVGVARSRTVKINPTTVDQLRAAVPLQINNTLSTLSADPTKYGLNLFNDVEIDVVNIEQKRNELGLLIWRGTIVGDPYGSVTLVFDNADITGRIMTQGQTFAITPTGQGQHRLTEIDESTRPELENDGIRPPKAAPSDLKPALKSKSSSESAQAAGTVITLLVTYTPSTVAAYPNIRSEISLALAWLNTALENSNVDAEVQIVGIDQVDYTNVAPGGDVLSDAKNGVGDFARIQNLRAALDADLLSVWAFEATGVGGIAYLLDDITEFPNKSEFGVSLVAYPDPDIFAHEIGHNLGGTHDRYVEDDDQPGPTAYNFGYVDTDAKFRTIMAYTNECSDLEISCARLQYYSTPDIQSGGAPIGIDSSLSEAAHNTRELGENISLVANLGSQLAEPSSPVLAVLLSGSGSVVSDVSGIDCGNSCSATFTSNDVVTLSAQHTSGWVFESWSGACTGSSRTCEVTMSQSASVTANFTTGVLPSVLFSSTQTTGQSFLRFYNSGGSSGVASVDLSNQETGEYLATWTSPTVAAGASIQVAVTDVESVLGAGVVKPSYYAATVKNGFQGWLQHVLWSPVDGTLTNLSTCNFGVTSGADALANVHTSQLDYGYPSTVIVSNSMSNSSTFTLGIYDAADGTSLGTYVTPSISSDGQYVVAIADIESNADINPAGINHYVIKVESFSNESYSQYFDPAKPAFLQHLVRNIQAGVITDMTTVCSFSDPPASYTTVAELRTGSLFSSEQTLAQSFLRFYNGGSSAGSVHVTLADSEDTRLGEWTSSSIQPGAAIQVPITELESSIGQGTQKPEYYAATVQTEFEGWLQHVLWSPADGTLTNLSTCEVGVVSNALTLNSVHTSTLEDGYPSTVVINNVSNSDTAVTLGLYDATTGSSLGSYSAGVVPARGQAVVPVLTMEAGAGVNPNGAYHYVINSETASFEGFLQHVVNNIEAGVITDMSTACQLPVVSLELGNNCEISSPCSLAIGASEQGQKKGLSGASVWYAVDLVQGTNYSVSVQGVSDGQGTLKFPFFRVYDSGFSIVTDSTETGSFTVDTTGQYLLAVGGSSNGPGDAAGTYVVSVQESN